ncbi:MAG: hypothetical protein ABIH28_01645 [archaeon]
MPAQDTSKTKEEIIEFLKMKGASLPVHIAQEIKVSPLFTSAFLSELFSEKRIKMSNLRVGSSPVYFLSGQEQDLEKYASHLKSKEKEAFILIKEKQTLKDEEQEPAIRVALRAIKDFAIPFEKENKLYWRYFIILEKEIKLESIKKEIEISEKKAVEKPKKEKKKSAKKTEKRKKGNEQFLLRVKEFLSKENIEIISIESFSKEGIILKVKTNGEEKALIAYSKKKIEEKDLINANKRAENLRLKYILLSLGEPTKKIKDLMEAIKNLSGIEKIE